MIQSLDISDEFYSKKRPYQPNKELLLGAGPSNCSARVLYTLSTAPVLIPGLEVFEIIKELKEMLKFVFQTRNDATLAIQTSGTGGLEAVLVNVVDPGEKILVAVNGFWGKRVASMATIRGIKVETVFPKSSMVFDLSELEMEIAKHHPVLLFITHGESSTGVLQSLEGLGKMCYKYNCLLFIDAVVTLGAVPLLIDRWGIDIAVSAPQKAARSLPGLAYLTFSPRAVERMKSITTPPPFYLNILKLCAVWKCFDEHSMYYYTYNSSLLCAAKEGLAEIIEDGLLETWEKHRKVCERLWEGLEKLGLQFFVKNPNHRLCIITCVYLPQEVEWKSLSTYLHKRYDLHLGVGIGPSSNNCFRIGIMGYNARIRVVDYVLEKLDEAIKYCRDNKILLNNLL